MEFLMGGMNFKKNLFVSWQRYNSKGVFIDGKWRHFKAKDKKMDELTTI
jgi:hypothetical protein